MGESNHRSEDAGTHHEPAQPILDRHLTIGLIGGVSWVSTTEYYRRINDFFVRRLGWAGNPGIVVCSLPFESILEHQNNDDSEAEAAILAEAARVLESAGVRVGLICSNTTNKTVRELGRATSIEFLDIVDAVIAKLRDLGLRSVGVLGTQHVMEESFYLDRLAEAGFDVRVPGPAIREELNGLIYDELCAGEMRKSTRELVREMVCGLAADGAEGVVLACTELPVLLPEQTVDGVALIDSLECHLEALYRALDSMDPPE